MSTIVLVERYRGWLHEKGIVAEQNEETGMGLPHILWMLNIMKSELLNDRSDFDLWKANRWLGFIQRDIIGEGMSSVEKERNYSRPLFKGTILPSRENLAKSGT